MHPAALEVAKSQPGEQLHRPGQSQGQSQGQSRRTNGVPGQRGGQSAGQSQSITELWRQLLASPWDVRKLRRHWATNLFQAQPSKPSPTSWKRAWSNIPSRKNPIAACKNIAVGDAEEAACHDHKPHRPHATRGTCHASSGQRTSYPERWVRFKPSQTVQWQPAVCG